MAVTADKYELPLCPPITCREMAERLGITPQSLQFRFTPTYYQRAAEHYRSRGKHRKRPFNIVQVELEEEKKNADRI